MTFAERLRELRDKAGLTQERLAETSGINIWTLRGYEQGRREPNWKGVIELARALRVAVEAFADCTSTEEENYSPTPNRPRGRPAKAPAVGQDERTDNKPAYEPTTGKKASKGQGRKRKEG